MYIQVVIVYTHERKDLQMATKREPKKPSEKVLKFKSLTSEFEISGRVCDLFAIMTAFNMAAQQERTDKHLILHDKYKKVADEIDAFLCATAKQKLKEVIKDEES